MPTYPLAPTPSSIHPPTIIDPAYRYESDQGYSVRRAKYMRPRRVYQYDYLGLTTANMRIIRRFLITQRLAALPFDVYVNGNTNDIAVIGSTTPVTLSFSYGQTEYMTNQWVYLSSSTVPTLNNTLWSITVVDPQTILLNNSFAAGTGTCIVYAYLPQAIGRFPEGVWETPEKLMGPVSTTYTRGRFSFSVMLEEIF